MKKKYYLALGLLATLASCSQDEVMEVNRSGDEITAGDVSFRLKF